MPQSAAGQARPEEPSAAKLPPTCALLGTYLSVVAACCLPVQGRNYAVSCHDISHCLEPRGKQNNHSLLINNRGTSPVVQ